MFRYHQEQLANIRAGRQRYLYDWLVFRDYGLEYRLQKAHNLLTPNKKNRRYYPIGPEKKQFGKGGSSYGSRPTFRKGDDQRGQQQVPRPPLGGGAQHDRPVEGGPGMAKVSRQEELERSRQRLRRRASGTFTELLGTGMDMNAYYTYDSWMVDCVRLMQDLGYLEAVSRDRCQEAYEEYRWWRRILHETVWRYRRGGPKAYGDARRARRFGPGTPYHYIGDRTGGTLSITGLDKPGPASRGMDHLQAPKLGEDSETENKVLDILRHLPDPTPARRDRAKALPTALAALKE